MLLRQGRKNLQFIINLVYLIAVYYLINVHAAYSQIIVSMGDSVRTCKGLDFSVSVGIKSSVALSSLIAYQIKAVFNQDLLRVIDVDYTNSLFEDWTANTWNVSDSIISIAGFSIDESNFCEDSASLFNILFSVRNDTVCTDSIKIEHAVFYTINDAVQADLEGKAVVSIIHNVPPVIKAFPEITIFEDSSKSIFLSKYISDQNDSINKLAISIIPSKPEFQCHIDTADWVLLLKPRHNWSGNGILSIKAEDPVGLSDSIGVPFTVISLPDSPGSFSLICPNDSALVLRDEPVNFAWHSSKNYDPGDSVTYRFFLDDDSLFNSPKSVVSISDTTFTMSSLPENGKYFWKVIAFDNNCLYTVCDKIFMIYFMDLSSVDTAGVKSIASYNLCQNRPNPFNCSTEIVFNLPEREHVVINIYNSLGKHIQTITNKIYDKGLYEIKWDAKDDYGLDVSSGVYIIRMNAGKFCATKKMILIR